LLSNLAPVAIATVAIAIAIATGQSAPFELGAFAAGAFETSLFHAGFSPGLSNLLTLLEFRFLNELNFLHCSFLFVDLFTELADEVQLFGALCLSPLLTLNIGIQKCAEAVLVRG